ncbi:MAG: hypothetical protein ABIH86_07205 [Planctomycetota bacterium]
MSKYHTRRLNVSSSFAFFLSLVIAVSTAHAIDTPAPIAYNDDFYENNDTIATAYDLETLPAGGLTLPGLKLYNTDYFSVKMPSDGRATFTVLFDHRQTDLFIAVYRAGIKIYESDVSTNDHRREDISVDVDEDETLVIGVGARSGESGPIYSLSIVLDDALEGAGNDSLSEAVDIGTFAGAFGETVSTILPDGEPLDALLLSDDEDWYGFQLPPTGAGYRLMTELQEYPTGRHMKVEVFNHLGVSIGSSDSLTVGYERVTLSLSDTIVRQYYVRVSASDILTGGYSARYSLRFYADDVFDDENTYGNDSLASAPVVDLPFYSESRRCFDHDVIAFDLAEGPVVVYLKHDSTAGNLNIQLSDTVTGDTVASSLGFGDVEVIHYVVESGDAGRYYLRVYPYDVGIHPNYELVVSQADRFEMNGADNHTLFNAIIHADIGDVGYGLPDLSVSRLFCYKKDYFRIRCEGLDQRLFAEARFDPAAGAIEMTVYNAAGNKIVESSTSTAANGVERVCWDATGGQGYFIATTYKTKKRWNIYSLTAGADDIDDKPDIEDAGDTLKLATDLYETYGLGKPSLSGVSSIRLDNRRCLDSDFYRIHSPLGGLIYFRVEFNANRGNIDAKLYDFNENVIATSAISHDYNDETDDYEEIIAFVKPGEDYVIKIFSTDGSARNGNTDYSLCVFIDDYFEPNDSFGYAWEMTFGRYPSVCLYDEDWFYVRSTGPGLFVARVDADGVSDTTTLKAYNRSGSLLSSSVVGPDGTALISRTVAYGEVIILSVTSGAGTMDSYANFDSRYSLTLTLDDAFEDNDSISFAYGISYKALYSDLYLHNNDWYSVTLPKNRAFKAAMVYNPAGGLLDLEAQNTSGLPIGTTSSSAGRVIVDVPSSTTDDRIVYLLASGASNPYPYTLVTGIEDGHEQNDSATAAKAISFTTRYANLFLADGDEDWFSITPSSDINAVIFVRHNHSAGDLVVELYNSGTMTLVAASDTDDGLEVIPYSLTAGVKYYIRIYGESNPRYELSVWKDDSREPNDSDLAAVPFVNNSTGRLLNNEDWFTYGPVSTTRNNQLTLTFTHAYGDLNLEIWNSDGSELIGASRSVTDNETLTWSGFKGESYLFRVVSPAGDFNSNYKITIGKVSSVSDDGLTEGSCAMNEERQKIPASWLSALAFTLIIVRRVTARSMRV